MKGPSGSRSRSASATYRAIRTASNVAPAGFGLKERQKGGDVNAAAAQAAVTR